MFEQYYLNEDDQQDYDVLSKATAIYNSIVDAFTTPTDLQPKAIIKGKTVVSDVVVNYRTPINGIYISTHSNPNIFKCHYTPQTKTVSIYVPDLMNNISKPIDQALIASKGIIVKTTDYLQDWVVSKDAKQLIVHELIHHMDFDRYQSPDAVLLKRKRIKDELKGMPTQTQKDAYYNSPEEYNAYFNQFLKKIQLEIPSEDLNKYRSSESVIDAFGENFLNKFNDIYKKKFITRFYRFWELVKSNKIDFLQ